MTKEELLSKLKKIHFPEHMLCIYDVGEADHLQGEECFVIGYNNETSFWEVFYGEHGQKSNLMQFSSDENAYDYFYNEVIIGEDNELVDPIENDGCLFEDGIEREVVKDKRKRETYKNKDFFSGLILTMVRCFFNNCVDVFSVFEYWLLWLWDDDWL